MGFEVIKMSRSFPYIT